MWHKGSRQPFADSDVTSALRYEAWYASPAGKRMAEAEEALLGRMLGRFSGARSLLEVGCGTGHFSRWFAERRLAVLGVDESAAMLAVARGLGGGPCYVQASALALPLGDRCVDLVAFVTSLEFIADAAAAVHEAARVARQGMLLGVLNLASPLGLARKALALRGSSPYREACFYTPWQLVRVLEQSLGTRLGWLEWHTTVWPALVPQAVRCLPFGAFIGAAAGLRES